MESGMRVFADNIRANLPMNGFQGMWLVVYTFSKSPEHMVFNHELMTTKRGAEIFANGLGCPCVIEKL